MPRLFVLSAPSGAGKTTLCRHLIASVPELGYSVSYTTRRPRPGEVDGVDYSFVNRGRFEAMIEAGEFLEWAKVFGRYYGTGRQRVAEKLESGINVIVDIDIAGARQIKSSFPQAVFIFILPPTFRELIRRLKARGTEGEAELRKRLNEAEAEIEARKMYDYLVINDSLDRAVDDLISLINLERLRMPDDDDQFWKNFYEEA
jgi:guanylate kinase